MRDPRATSASSGSHDTAAPRSDDVAQLQPLLRIEANSGFIEEEDRGQGTEEGFDSRGQGNPSISPSPAYTSRRHVRENWVLGQYPMPPTNAILNSSPADGRLGAGPARCEASFAAPLRQAGGETDVKVEVDP